MNLDCQSRDIDRQPVARERGPPSLLAAVPRCYWFEAERARRDERARRGVCFVGASRMRPTAGSGMAQSLMSRTDATSVHRSYVYPPLDTAQHCRTPLADEIGSPRVRPSSVTMPRQRAKASYTVCRDAPYTASSGAVRTAAWSPTPATSSGSRSGSEWAAAPTPAAAEIDPRSEKAAETVLEDQPRHRRREEDRRKEKAPDHQHSSPKAACSTRPLPVLDLAA